jgi:hypothetical protein
VLWLWDNPCSDIPNYREIIIKHLPNLQKLDNMNITGEEKACAQKISFSLFDFDIPGADDEHEGPP